MKRIVVVGAGQLGSRYLQGLKAVSIPLEIEVIDPEIASLELAKERYSIIPESTAQHRITFNTALTAAKNDDPIDIAIIATTAKHRMRAVENLLQKYNVRFLILEKILFSQFADYSHCGKLLEEKKVEAFVNCCMRMMPFYKKLTDDFFEEKIYFQVTGSQYGLITNAIHYLDYVAYLTGCHDFVLDTSSLDKKPIASKRNGYLELNGALIAHYKNGSVVMLNCNAEGQLPVQIEIMNDKQRVISHEWQQKAIISKEQDQWHWHEAEAKIPYQSELTFMLVNELLTTSTCSLVPYAISKHIHLQMLEPLRSFLSEHGYVDKIDYPFT